MLSQVERLIAPSRIDVRIHLCRQPPAYGAGDEIAGNVVLACGSQVDISSISIKLSGLATSRVQSGRLTESHQLCKITEQLFPPTKCSTSFTPRAVTVPPGEHVFPFSIKFPQAAQCHRSTASSCEQRKSHLHTQLQRGLPPSTGGSRSPDEVKYVLETTVRQDGLIRATKRATRDISLTTNSTTIAPTGRDPQSVTKHIICSAGPDPGPDPDEDEDTPVPPYSQSYPYPYPHLPSRLPPSLLTSTSTCTIKATLLDGPFLVRGHPIPLAVEMTRAKTTSNSNPTPRHYAHEAMLHDFQSMLLETTDIRARGVTESATRPVVVQTMANFREPFVPVEASSGCVPGCERMLRLDGRLWSQYTVPDSLSPSFETCNLARRYKLEIRLGIQFARGNMRIVEFQFPIHVASPAGTDSAGTGSVVEAAPRDSGIAMPAPEYREKVVYGKEVEGAGEY
ncbi:uncharacterized protein BDV17DRAFT_261141 [Aspergillus undulatus]|uniref:uncharacterized protein n=1 Tax=Aspergillus undulatus TaxID=1810928 RepID=UPI003CCE065E